jgi:hypothetical protein
MAEKSGNKTEKKTAGAFDIRTVIGALLAVYGVILTLMGLFGDAETEKTGGVNANLWAGLVMLVVGVGFLVWARVKPVVVAEVPPQ